MKRWSYLLILVSLPVHAEVITDGSLGAKQTFSGQFQIPQTLGTTVGNNLFHSFQQFSLQQGESATFTGDKALKNVISRVTGGNVSTIDGLLKSTIGTANFYFINPAGVTFGASAQVDVPAAFHLSTADNVKFADGKQFAASLTAPSVLSIAEPTGFGFLGTQTASIQIQQSILSFKSGSQVSFSAGDILIDGATVTNPVGDLQFYSTGTVASDITPQAPVNTALSGKLELKNVSYVSVTGENAGRLLVRAGDVTLTGDSGLYASNRGSLDAKPTAGINLLSNTLVLDNSSVYANALATGNAGHVAITSKELTLVNSGLISSDTDAQGNAGNVTVEANTLTVDGKGATYVTGITSDANASSRGNAGYVAVKAKQLTVVNDGKISSNARTGSTGDAGTVSIQSDNLTVSNGGQISSSTWGTGKAGDLVINAPQLRVEGQDTQGNSAWIASNTNNNVIDNAGNAGVITIKSDNLNVFNGGKISSNTFGSGDAGTVAITAGTVVVDGQKNGAWIVSETLNGSLAHVGNAGTIRLQGNNLNVFNGGEVSSSTWGLGNAGDITINVGKIVVDGQGNNAWIASNTENTTLAKAGNAGTVRINGDSLQVLKGGRISSATQGAGNAANVELTVREVIVDGQGNGAWITSNTENSTLAKAGKAGTVSLKSNNLRVLNSGQVASNTYGTGDAGTVAIEADTISVDGQGNNAWISSATTNTGNAGTVTMKSSQLSVVNNGEISSSTHGTGNAGNIVIDSQNLQMDGGDSGFAGVSSNTYADATGGKAGNVAIRSNTLSLRNGAEISSSTWSSGDAGNIAISGQQISIDGTHSGIFSSSNSDSTGNAGLINVTGENLTVASGGQLSSSTWSLGNAGGVTIAVANLVVKGQDNQGNSAWIASNANNKVLANAGHAGTVSIQDSNLSVLNKGRISSTTSGTGNAGNLIINSANTVVDNGSIYSDANVNSAGHAGTLSMTGQTINVLNHGKLTSNTSGSGDAGTLHIKSDRLNVFNDGVISSDTNSTGNAGSIDIQSHQTTVNNASIYSDANSGSSGNAGTITISGDSLSLLNSGLVTSDTYASGNAGSVSVVTKDLLIDRQGGSYATGITSDALDGSSGNAGTVSIAGTHVSVLNSGQISSDTYAVGKAGDVSVKSEQLTIANAGIVSSTTFAEGNAGDVVVDSATIMVDGQNASYPTGIVSDADSAIAYNGNAGNVSVKSGNLTLLNGGRISSVTFSQGHAGNVVIHAENIAIAENNSDWFTGITSDTVSSLGSGHAGSVLVNATNNLTLLNRGAISSSTQSPVGAAGSVQVNADTIALDKATISAAATAGSSGKTGSINVTATQAIDLSNDSKITLQNDATVTDPKIIVPTTVTLTAPTINLKNSYTTTDASKGNVNASNIVINFSDKLLLDPSYITTTANTGNGGMIDINGGKVIYLQDSGFKTSVSGASSNGGNINVTADVLVMNTGVIQANAIGGVGGDINLQLQALIPSYNSLIKGGKRVDWQPYTTGLNVIQAASENGVSGTLNITAPQFDISGSLSGLDASSLVLPEINQTGCGTVANQASSLARQGQGGIPLKESQAGFIPPAHPSAFNLPTLPPHAEDKQVNTLGNGTHDKKTCAGALPD